MFKSITSGLQKIFGSKYDRDIKAMQPIIDEINEHFATYAQLSNDELRGKTRDFRARIAEHLSEIDAEIAELEAQTKVQEDLYEKEALFADLDKLREQRDEELEIILKELLPEAFAVVKETARRFTEEEELVVTATDHDRELAAKGQSDKANKDYITIDGDQAIYRTSWTAAGGEIDWGMVHYDVQLIGGMVLHEGKVMPPISCTS